jgi:hypothetical protein
VPSRRQTFVIGAPTIGDLMSFPPIHRVVTGHDADGKAVVASSGPLPRVIEIAAIPGTVFHEVWSTACRRASTAARIRRPAR